MPYPDTNPFHIGVVVIDTNPILLGSITGADDLPDELVNLIIHFADGTGVAAIGDEDIDLATYDGVIATFSVGDTFNLGGGDNRIARLQWKKLYLHGTNATDSIVLSGQVL